MAELPPPPSPTLSAIYASYEDDRRDERRPHLGASEVGRECDRELWLSFRWATQAEHSGRLLRLFETGDHQEARLVANLRRIGVTVLEVNPDDGRQWRVEALSGHLAGSMDGVALGVLEAPKTWHLLEFKTHNARSFTALKKHGVAKSKPEHEAQMQIYMHLAGLDRALYLAVGKNTDELYLERVKHDAAAAIRLIERARRIIFSARPPVRISLDPDKLPCRFCNFRDLCHTREKLPELSCRTCMHSTPQEDGGWLCERWGETLDLARQKVGCPHYLHHPDLVPGEQTDAGTDWIAYRMDDGTTWVDGFAPTEVPVDDIPFTENLNGHDRAHP